MAFDTVAPASLPRLNAAGIAGAVAGLLSLALICRVIYNLYFHPLRNFPGPFFYRASRLAYVYRLLNGTLPFRVLELHDKYGPVVRIAPEELAFIDPQAWKDIYGHRTGQNYAAGEMSKPDLFYRTKGTPPSLIAETRENHAMVRKAMSHGFSERAMREQEPIIGGYVALLMKRLREHSVEAQPYSDEEKEKGQEVEMKPKALDLKTWYNWTTFDIIGDLAFGEPFGCLEEAKYHPWVDAIANSFRGGAFMIASKYLGIDGVLLPIMQALMSSRKAHTKMTKDKLERRMALEGDRHDLIEGLLKKKDEWKMDFPRLRMNAGLLVIAGSETTATLLSGATFLLLTHPEVLEKLTAEVRSSFKTEEEITLTSVGNLSYMLACLNESFRRYPPVPMGMPRMVPKGGATIAGHFVPENTFVACWQWAINHSTTNWEDPYDFKPERFLDPNKDTQDRLDAMQPFSVGPRNCIGRNLAYAEMRLILARILFNFDMKLAHPENNWLDQKVYTLWFKPKLEVYLTPVVR